MADDAPVEHHRGDPGSTGQGGRRTEGWGRMREVKFHRFLNEENALRVKFVLERGKV